MRKKTLIATIILRQAQDDRGGGAVTITKRLELKARLALIEAHVFAF
jgi:hypothetical protein